GPIHIRTVLPKTFPKVYNKDQPHARMFPLSDHTLSDPARFPRAERSTVAIQNITCQISATSLSVAAHHTSGSARVQTRRQGQHQKSLLYVGGRVQRSVRAKVFFGENVRVFRPLVRGARSLARIQPQV